MDGSCCLAAVSHLLQKMYFTLSADGDKACQDPLPEFSWWQRHRPCRPHRAATTEGGWNRRSSSQRGGERLFWLSMWLFPTVWASFQKHRFLLSSYSGGLRLLKVQRVLWAFVSCWDNAGLISSLAETNNLGEMLQGLINNNSVILYVLITNFVLGEKCIFSPSLELEHRAGYMTKLLWH